MESSIIHDAIRRTNRNLMMVGVILVLGVAIAAGLSINYFYNFFLGPFPISHQELVNLDINSAQQYYVTVVGDDVADTGWEYIRTSNGRETVERRYAALFVGNRLLLVSTRDTIGSTATFTGSLIPMSSDVRNEVIAGIENEVPGVRGLFLPYMLTTDAFHISGIIGMVVGGVVLIIGVWMIMRVMRRRANPNLHPIMKSLAKFGDPDMVVNQIEMDMQRGQRKLGRLTFTTNWLFQSSLTSFTATRHSDIAWLYKLVTQRRTNGIPTGKTYSAMIWDRHGTCLRYDAREGDVNAALNAVSQMAPWALGGFSTELDNLWKKNRPMFLASVDDRKRQYAQQARQKRDAASDA